MLLVIVASAATGCAIVGGITDDYRTAAQGGADGGGTSGGAAGSAGGAGVGGAAGAAGSGCAGSGYTCAARVPSGWSGPVALATVSGGAFPPCGGDYATLVVDGNDGLTAPDYNCKCTCPAQASGTVCSPQITAQGYSVSTCGSATTNNTYQAGVCSSAPATINVIAVASISDPGSCTATPMISPTPSTWASSYAVCGYSGPPGGACAGGGKRVCAPGAGFPPKLCVYINQDAQCPGAPYTQRTTFTTKLDDQRGCTTCSCAISGGQCSGTGSSYNATACGGTPSTLPSDGSCRLTPSVKSVKFDQPVLKVAPTCTSNGGKPIGKATASDPVTVCCEP